MREMSNEGFKDQVCGAARALDGHGKRVWQEHEGEFRDGARQAGYVAAVVANLIALYILNNLLAWQVPFLTESFVVPLAVFNVSVMASIGAHVLFLVYDPKWFRLLVKLGLNVIALGAVYTLFIIFPFDFGTTGLDIMVKISLVVVMVGIVIGSIVELVQLIFGWYRE